MVGDHRDDVDRHVVAFVEEIAQAVAVAGHHDSHPHAVAVGRDGEVRSEPWRDLGGESFPQLRQVLWQLRRLELHPDRDTCPLPVEEVGPQLEDISAVVSQEYDGVGHQMRGLLRHDCEMTPR